MNLRNFLCLAIIISYVVSAPATAETTTMRLAQDLYQKLREEPESLRWRMPNHKKPLTHENIGIDAEQCGKPVPALTGQTPRFLIRCVTSQVENLRVIVIRSVTSWTYVDGKWEAGQIVSVHRLLSRSGRSLTVNELRKRYIENKHQINLKLGWHKGGLVGPYEEAFASLSESQISDLRGIWKQILTEEDFSLGILEQWRDLPWPDGVVGLRRDGDLLLQKGVLAGADELLEKLSEENSLPTFAKGLIRPIPSIRSWQSAKPPGTPMFLLDTLYANNKDYVIALSDILPDKSQNNTQLLSTGQTYHLVFMPIERNL